MKEKITIVFSLKYIVIVALVLFKLNNLQAQQVKINASEKLNVLLHYYEKQCKEKDYINGYRIHITSSVNRNDLNKLKARVYSEFPDMQPFLSYQAPNFKLRVGNYFYKIDAYQDLQKIAPNFPGAFIVTDELKWSEL